eukprot:TRINITY_DN735_c0_g1_i1.p1 TRINITY_DN735_c0_g1~~TRINITY_DN735_c0_g1_i1.p1  ORF type:complete len:442 (+),score=89.76 TRINITY_DN735_c0_g1_i1:324-1649(+)
MSTPKNFERMASSHPDGGFLFLALTDEEAAVQRKAVWDMLSSFGKNLASKKNITNISFPVTVFEPRSYLERLVDGWWGAPTFLKKAAESSDPVERFKLVITFAIAGFQNTCAQMKPFNPILGETHQATFGDGTRIYCEQSSHHPPVSNFLVFGPKEEYRFYGFGEWHASFRVNTVKGHQRGPHTVEFPDGTKITYNLPWMNVHGIIYGDRIIEYEGPMEFRDEKHGLACDIEFNPKQESGGFFSSWFSKAKLPTDYFRGNVVKYDPSKGKGDDDEVLFDVQGTWLGAIEFGDGDRTWDFQEEYTMYEPARVPNPLPSDCRYREDVNFLKDGDTSQSQEAKEKLEKKQRAEAALRKEGAKEGEKESKKQRKMSKKKSKGEKGAAEDSSQPSDGTRIFKAPEPGTHGAASEPRGDGDKEKKKNKKAKGTDGEKKKKKKKKAAE